MSQQSIMNHLDRKRKLQNGESIECPFCKKGAISGKNGIYLCNKCGHGIVGTMKLNRS